MEKPFLSVVGQCLLKLALINRHKHPLQVLQYGTSTLCSYCTKCSIQIPHLFLPFRLVFMYKALLHMLTVSVCRLSTQQRLIQLTDFYVLRSLQADAYAEVVARARGAGVWS
jgi:hypothetical protein